ncbi:hypothetical protein TIFTF001_035726 [Ficus carica]|uniref:Uncharacterized protein n=1 Tax=Ficus carica TaxID=3494 RepID=A0AA88E223_FICCA|nr:hypothetical protein TIFTF001_035726 [Ficus carica]
MRSNGQKNYLMDGVANQAAMPQPPPQGPPPHGQPPQ